MMLHIIILCIQDILSLPHWPGVYGNVIFGTTLMMYYFPKLSTRYCMEDNGLCICSAL